MRRRGRIGGAAALCGTTHKTVKRVLARRAAGAEPGRLLVRRPRNTDAICELIDRRVRETDGRMRCLLPLLGPGMLLLADRAFDSPRSSVPLT